MKIITKPTVNIVGRQIVNMDGMDNFLTENGITWASDAESPAEYLMETAGRLCYMSFENPRPGGNKTYLRNIKSSGHGSVLEHSVWNIVIQGISRSLSHELVRHRAGMAYSQLSQRYVDESVAEYILPPDILKGSEIYDLWEQTIKQSHEAYVKLSNMLTQKYQETNVKGFGEGIILTRTELQKKARSAARSVLPNATETKIFVTANGRALRHILEMRGSKHADSEIRILAQLLLEKLQLEAPVMFGDYSVVGDQIQTEYKKV